MRELPAPPAGDPGWWREQFWGSQQQMLQHVGWASTLIWHLPEQFHNEELHPTVQGACLEAFLVNARLLCDFLTTRGDRRDFSAWDFVADWIPDPVVAERLRTGVWRAASEQVVHFSRARVQDPDAPIYFDTSLEGLSAIREDIRALYNIWDTQRRVAEPLGS